MYHRNQSYYRLSTSWSIERIVTGIKITKIRRVIYASVNAATVDRLHLFNIYRKKRYPQISHVR